MRVLETEEPLAFASVKAIHTGDVEALQQLLEANPDLSTARLGDPTRGMSRTLLHVATDWPGNFPNVAKTIDVLIRFGADVNARFTGPHTETPLHWAASCDDVSALDALLDHGADIEAGGGVIGNGTPLADAVAFAQWKTARRLIERGAEANLWQAAGLGLMERLKALLAAQDPPSHAPEITGAFWCACHGGQLEAAEHLLQCGADMHWVGYDELTPLQAARRSNAQDVVNWLTSLQDQTV